MSSIKSWLHQQPTSDKLALQKLLEMTNATTPEKLKRLKKLEDLTPRQFDLISIALSSAANKNNANPDYTSDMQELLQVWMMTKFHFLGELIEHEKTLSK